MLFVKGCIFHPNQGVQLEKFSIKLSNLAFKVISIYQTNKIITKISVFVTLKIAYVHVVPQWVRGLYKYQFLHHSYLEHPKMLFSRFPYFDNEAVISKSKELFTFLCENLPNSSKFLSGWRAIRFCAGFLSLGPCPGEGSGS